MKAFIVQLSLCLPVAGVAAFFSSVSPGHNCWNPRATSELNCRSTAPWRHRNLPLFHYAPSESHALRHALLLLNASPCPLLVAAIVLHVFASTPKIPALLSSGHPNHVSAPCSVLLPVSESRAANNLQYSCRSEVPENLGVQCTPPLNQHLTSPIRPIKPPLQGRP